MAHKLLDITPTPQVLVALTRTPITPLDALSELIDNAIDSFRAAEVSGSPSPVRQVLIEVPGAAEVRRGEGIIRVRDTGPGLTEEQIADAMRAGYSSKNHFDTLGLFGMGFNIATGKLGRVTRVICARTEQKHAIQVTLDLPRLLQTGAFTVHAEQVEKPRGLEHGTVVEIRGWWPEGDANRGFIRDLVKIPKNTLRDRIGRRYATLLRGEVGAPVVISVNSERCRAFEHCVWSESRFVERQGHGKIPAQIRFDEEVDRSRRCLHDGAEFGAADACPRCGRRDSREIAQRVRGWVGIQRFDDQNDFGIDLIRNGRAIRIAEKSAFFEYTDETVGKVEREYPIDQQYGRIIGEVHVDQVPVDFQKQNFQQSSTEWQAALQFLRGGSLLPTKWKDGERNDSPISRLFQGYRKVRNFGRADMYMGQYNPAKGKADRISRETERAYYQRFLDREPGYHDDERWWELVERATEPPLEELPECPDCGFQNPSGAEACGGCSRVLDGRPCLNAACRQVIARSATACSHCGASQTPKIELPWTCAFCRTENKAGDEHCRECGIVEGAPHPASPEALAPGSEENAELGASRLTVTLADGRASDPLDITVRTVARPIIAAHGCPPVPLVTDVKSGHLTIYTYLSHPAFTAMGVRPEYLIASEAGQYLHALHANLRGRPGHTVSALTAELLKEGWGDTIAENADTVRDDIKSLFNSITEKLLDAPHADDFYDELDEAQQRAMADSVITSGVDLSELERLKTTGAYLRYCDRDTLAAFFARYPQGWFGGRVWRDPWPHSSALGPVVAEKLQHELSIKYLRCLEDCASYIRYEQPERLLVVRARAAAEFLSDKLS
ncbi:ATP-binding protein [Streptomyces cylindrosporus]|uniref:ATP-binding protein n=1 Tax=Streptomyces cylindrosporus TaxID=2927583 RepID=A0ABS9YGV8_9ACTN|nr:ATP-binding protein [Streptomyces cylindrosporus]MCI3276482.1 ATP-binding protein [Streptomyces cylindrosporus]